MIYFSAENDLRNKLKELEQIVQGDRTEETLREAQGLYLFLKRFGLGEKAGRYLNKFYDKPIAANK